jgi:hypothetical protein
VRVLYFIDFEASSLYKGSFPVEVAWVAEDGVGESHLIRPAPGWTEWSPASERIHGISRSRLEAEGEDHLAVARRVLEVLHPDRAVVFSDNPAFDGFWLDMLLTAAGCFPIPRLLDAVKLNLGECAALEAGIAAPPVTPDDHRRLRVARDRASVIIGNAEGAHEREHTHRALDDATQLWRVWRDVRDAVARALSGT